MSQRIIHPIPTDWSIAPYEATYEAISTDAPLSALRQSVIVAKGLNKFKGLSIGNRDGQLCIVPLDESCREWADYIVQAVNAYEDLVEAIKASEREYENLEDTAPVDSGCIECTWGTVPNNLNTGLCAHHLRVKALKKLGAA